MAAGISGPHLSHDEVLQVARNSEPMLAGLLHAFLARLGAADDQGL
jgi:purine nucleoside phosphorylase